MVKFDGNSDTLYQQVTLLLEKLGNDRDRKVKLEQIYQILSTDVPDESEAQAEETNIETIKSRYQHFCLKIKPLLEPLYGIEKSEELIQTIYQLLRDNFAQSMTVDWHKWSENNILLITYGDTIYSEKEKKPLVTLANFLKAYLQDIITGVHILPFNPYSSDDGFAVIDYLQVNPKLGDWEDVGVIAENFKLMVDLVINHVSSEHEWFKQFLAGEKPGCDYFIEASPEEDLSEVVRPRNIPLLTEVETTEGEKKVCLDYFQC